MKAMDRMKMEILMATHNGERYLQEQLDSVLKQTEDGWHLSVSDDEKSEEGSKAYGGAAPFFLLDPAEFSGAQQQREKLHVKESCCDPS